MSSDLTDLTGLVTRYATAHAALVAHPDFEAGCPPDRLYHARDDAAVEVAEAVTRLLDAQGAQDSPVGLSPADHHDPTQEPVDAVEHMRVQDAIEQRPRAADAPASWVARITGPCWIVDGNDGWEQPHYPGSFAAAQAAQRDAAEDGTDPRPIRQLDRECWAAARDGHLVEDDDLGLVHHCTEGDARAAAGPAGDDTAPTAEPVSGSFDVDRLHPFHRN